MSLPRTLISRLARPVLPSTAPTALLARHTFGTSAPRLNNDNKKKQQQQQPNQAIPNTTSTMTKDFPKVGDQPAPPEMLSSVDPDYRPADPYPGKVEHFTGGRQGSGPQKPELGVGEMEGITFKVEPLKREGEDVATMRARLLCMFSLSFFFTFQSRGGGGHNSDPSQAGGWEWRKGDVTGHYKTDG